MLSFRIVLLIILGLSAIVVITRTPASKQHVRRIGMTQAPFRIKAPSRVTTAFEQDWTTYCQSRPAVYLQFRYHGYGGVGNVALGLVSTFLLAMLTQRAFRIHPETFLNDSYLNPFEPFTDWTDSIPPHPQPSIATYDIFHVLDLGPHDAIACTDLRFPLHPARSIEVRSNQYYVPLLFLNPHYRPTLDRWFPLTTTHVNDVFRTLASKLFRLRPQVQQRVDAFLTKHPPGTFVGLHVRNHRNKHEPRQDQHFIRCMQQFDNQTIFFLATMYAATREAFVAAVGPARVLMSTAEPVEWERRLFMRDYTWGALVDIWILAHARHVLLSGYSTFGAFAVGLSQATHHVDVTNTNNGTVFRCRWLTQATPCLHTWTIWGQKWKYADRLSCRHTGLTIPLHVAPWREDPTVSACQQD
jgi:hypothetical protein